MAICEKCKKEEALDYTNICKVCLDEMKSDPVETKTKMTVQWSCPFCGKVKVKNIVDGDTDWIYRICEETGKEYQVDLDNFDDFCSDIAPKRVDAELRAEHLRKYPMNKEELRFLHEIEELKWRFFGMHEDDQKNTTLTFGYYDLKYPKSTDGLLENFKETH